MQPEGTPPRILIVDDDAQLLRVLSRQLIERGFGVSTASTLHEAIAACEARIVDAIVLDHSLAETTSAQALPALRTVDASITIVVLSGSITVAETAHAIRQGAEDVQSKPPELDLLQVALERGLQRTALLRARALMASQVVDPFGIFDHAPTLQRAIRQIEQVAPRDLPLLLVGERGTGKRALAELAHQLSKVSDQPFLTIAMQGRSEEQLNGVLEQLVRSRWADGQAAPVRGTVYFDDVGVLTSRQQLLLLELVDPDTRSSQGVRPMGPRVIASTQRHLADEVRAGRFHAGLHQRLAVVPIAVPALRERGAPAIRALAERTRHRLRVEVGEGPESFSPDALDWICSLPWPDNIPQLCDVVEESFARAVGSHEISAADLTPALVARGLHAGREDSASNDWSLRNAEKRHITAVLSMASGHRTQAAKLLGITRTTLYKKMAEYGLADRAE